MDVRDLACEAIVEALGDLRGKSILDVGCGSGNLVRQLAARGAAVTALDFEPRAEALGAAAAVVAHDLTSGTLPFADATMDCVASTEVLEHLRAPFLVLSAMVRVLKPGGALVLSLPNYWNLKYRLRYLVSGNVPRPFLDDGGRRAMYARGLAPHINVFTYPTLRTLLQWEGCRDFVLRSPGRPRFGQLLALAPIFGAVKLFTCLAGREWRRRHMLEATNSTAVLLGKRHVLLRCSKGTPE